MIISILSVSFAAFIAIYNYAQRKILHKKVDELLQQDLLALKMLQDALQKSTETLVRVHNANQELISFGHNSIWMYGDNGGELRDVPPEIKQLVGGKLLCK